MSNQALTGEHFIGKHRSREAGGSFSGVDPTTGTTLEPVYGDATDNEVQTAVTLAQSAFTEYRDTSVQQRARFLEAAAEQIVLLGDTLVSRCCAETGLPEGRIRGERGRTMNQLKMFATLVREGSWVEARIDTADPGRTPVPKPDVRSVARPLGPVAVFGASNFPLAFSVAGGDTASALAAGCPVVFKGHPAHPGTCELVAGAIIKAALDTGMPDGVFSLVHGRSHAVGLRLITHPLVKAIGFTGSLRGGRALYDAAAARPEPIPVYAEMGSINPVFLLPGAAHEQLDDFAKGYIGSFTLGAGQFCTNPGVAVVLDQSDTTDQLTAKLQSMMSETDPATMLSSEIRKAYAAGAEKIAGQDEVAEVAQGTAGEHANAAEARLFKTTSDAFLSNVSLHDEVFGPASLIVSASQAPDLVRIAETLRGHLTASVFGTDDDLREHRRLLEVLAQKVGRLIINGFPTGVEVCDAMIHGGPYPATTDSRTTSVGTLAIRRFVRPVCYQNFPDDLLPPALQSDNPLEIWRLVNGAWRKGSV
jgi:alpha-ketoglutaric semialdehyde dehydrogenase